MYIASQLIFIKGKRIIFNKPNFNIMAGLNVEKKRKNIDLTEDCIKNISKLAIDKGTNFKTLAQEILEEYSQKRKEKNKDQE